MIKVFFKKIFGFYPMCVVRSGKNGWFRYPYKARQNTNYEDDSKNFFFGCKKCHKMNDEYWEEEWKNVTGYG